MKIEERRRAIARRVLELAAVAKSKDELITLVHNEFRRKPIEIGSGCFRTAYCLPWGLVLKIQHREFYDDNKVEYEAYVKRPDLVVPVYGYLKTNYLNALVQRKAKLKPDVLWDSEKQDYTPECEAVRAYMSDGHRWNMGFIGKRLMIVDAGNGLRV